MEITPEEELDMIYQFCYGDHDEISSFQEISEAHPISKPNDNTKNTDLENLDEESNIVTKRQRAKMEKKRRHNIRHKVDILQSMTPNSKKTGLSGKLDEIIEYLRGLQYQREMMSTVYAAKHQFYPSPYYGAQPPCMCAWGYYAPGIPTMPQQNMPYNPQYDQVHDMAPRDQTKP